MTDGPTNPVPTGGSKSLVNRVKDILMSPKTEWGVIDAEPATVSSIFTGYVMILAAIGPIAGLIGQQLMGLPYIGKPPMMYSISMAVLSYVLSLVAVYVFAMIIDALAPSFGGTKDSLKALKVAAYSWTAAWVAGIFGIIPMLGILAIVGLYSLYLLYLGLPKLMRVADDKAMGYTIVVIVVQIVIYFLCAWLVTMLVLSIVGPMMIAPVIRY